MSTRAQWIVVAGIVAALGASLWAAVRSMQGSIDPLALSSAAPDFTAAAVPPDTGVRKLSDFRGKVVLLNVWATWCGPCRTEMPSLERLHREFADDGLEILAVSVDDAVGKRGIRDFANDLGLTFTILHDSTRAIDRIYQLTGYPVTFIIDREGRIRRRHLGALEWDSYPSRALVASLLDVTIAPDTGRTVTPRASAEGS